MRHFFVINPHSFSSQKCMKSVQDEIDNCFSAGHKTDYTIYISRRPRDAIAVLHRFLLSIKDNENVRIYAVGGDGILFDCLNGIVGFPNAELTSIPYGNANDLVRAFGKEAIPVFRDIKRLIDAPSRPVDIINYGANYAMNEANIGIAGLTVCYANAVLRKADFFQKKHKRNFVSQIYTFSALKSMMDKEVVNQHYTIKIDDRDISGNYSNILISNCPCSGSNMVPNPYAIPDDGQLEVIFSCTNSVLDFLNAFGDYQKGFFEKHKIFRHEKCKKMEVHSEKPLRVQLDGESFFAHELLLKLIPGGIKFAYPEGLNFKDYSYLSYRNKKLNRGLNNAKS